MKDTELRGLLLKKYYEDRRKGFVRPKPEDFSEPLTSNDIVAISVQLSEHRLVDWKSAETLSDGDLGWGKISAHGVDVIEGAAQPDVRIEFVQHKSVNISESSNIVVGDRNTFSVTNHIEALASAIDAADAKPEQKKEAKGKLSALLKHPLVLSLVGASATLLAKKLD